VPGAIAGLLLDIEGTTTPISFVYDTLFPYAEAKLGDACAAAARDAPLAEAVALLREEHRREASEGADVPAFGDGSAYARYLMGHDRKSTGLKALQGLIWRAGYEDGSLRGQVFPDVVPALERWRDAGLAVRIFSSGSVLAQKLLFGHTEQGDLTPCFDGYHDTTTGPKKEAASYVRIAAAFGLPPESILFLSDVVAELDAAREAGMRTGLLQRPGNPPADAGTHPAHRSFEGLP
jgi:enolase-phosphatase E1